MAGGNIAQQALDKLDVSTFYPVVTLLFVFCALFETALAALMGGLLLALVQMLLLTVKYFVGKTVSKIPGADLLGKESEEDAEKKSNTSQVGAKAVDEAKKEAVKALQKTFKTGTKAAAGKAKFNPWVLLVDYVTTPMGKFEKIIFAFGWVLLPIAIVFHVAGVFAVICTGTDVLVPIVSICNSI
jgi:hypothetical protein